MKLIRQITVIFLAAALLLPFVAACQRNGTSDELERQEQTFYVMDTFVDVIIWTAKDSQEVEEIFQEVEAELKRLHDIFSAFEDDSDVARISAAAGVSPVAVHAETLEVVQTALDYAVMTDGKFDITLAPVLRLYSFGENERVPTEQELAEKLPLVDYSLVEVDQDAGTVFLPQQGMSMDLGGIAKGYVVDIITEMLRNFGVETGVVNAGGDISFVGPKYDGTPWRIGIKDPNRHLTHQFAVIEAEGGAIVTSGNYERYVEKDGVRYHHIIDPADGRPARGCKSVTIVAPNAMLADLLSTAVFVMGPEAGMALVESLEGIEALIWDAEDQVQASSGLVWEDRR